ncbi:MAG: ABC transporter substrate-binding protein [Dehalococcoidales bacterium]
MKGKWSLIFSIIGILAITGLSLSLYFAFEPPPASSIAITDDLGRTVFINSTPQSFVSHVPGITEILFALGLEEKIVGVSNYCDYPEEAKLKGKVGDFWSPTIEKIVDLDPDLVFTHGSNEQIMIQLGEVGITCIALQPQNMDEILRDIELVGRVTGTEKRARELIKDMQKRISYVTTRVEDAPRPRVFYIIEAIDLSHPWTAGPGSFIDSIITMAGGENIGAKAQSRWSQFSVEEVVNSDPEVIIMPIKHGSAFTPPEALKEHPAWQGITAVKQDRIFTIDDNLVSRYGPRVALGLDRMAKIIHPEAFK